MKIQPIDNNPVFQKLIVKNPRQMPKEVYRGIVENDGIQDLANSMQKKGMDLIAEYIKPNYNTGNARPTRSIYLYNAKQFYNKYFKYNEEPFKDEYKSIYSINSQLPNSDEQLLDELYFFDPYDIRVEVHNEICHYFNKIKEERAKEELGNKLQESVEPKKQSFWKRLFR